MAATAVFEPQTTSFGQLVVAHTSRRWARTGVDNGASRQARTNLFISLGFVVAFVTFLSGLYVVDSSVFPHGYAQSPDTTTASVDYD